VSDLARSAILPFIHPAPPASTASSRRGPGAFGVSGRCVQAAGYGEGVGSDKGDQGEADAMSKRRTDGEIVQKRAGAGFKGDPMLVKVIYHLYEDEQAEPCWCDDPDCRCFANVEIMTVDGRSTGEYVYHVSECQMDDHVISAHKES
jgi:hypothetical protein